MAQPKKYHFVAGMAGSGAGSYLALAYSALQNVVIWFVRYSSLSQLISMNATVRLMVIDAQEPLAVRKLAFPATGRSLQFLCHSCSCQVNHQKEKLQRLVASSCGLKMSDLYVIHLLYNIIGLCHAFSFNFFDFSDFSSSVSAQNVYYINYVLRLDHELSQKEILRRQAKPPEGSKHETSDDEIPANACVQNFSSQNHLSPSQKT